MEFEIKGLFDNIHRELLIKTIRKYTKCKWELLIMEAGRAERFKSGSERAWRCNSSGLLTLAWNLFKIFLNIIFYPIDKRKKAFVLKTINNYKNCKMS